VYVIDSCTLIPRIMCTKSALTANMSTIHLIFNKYGNPQMVESIKEWSYATSYDVIFSTNMGSTIGRIDKRIGRTQLPMTSLCLRFQHIAVKMSSAVKLCCWLVACQTLSKSYLCSKHGCLKNSFNLRCELWQPFTPQYLPALLTFFASIFFYFSSRRG